MPGLLGIPGANFGRPEDMTFVAGGFGFFAGNAQWVRDAWYDALMSTSIRKSQRECHLLCASVAHSHGDLVLVRDLLLS